MKTGDFLPVIPTLLNRPDSVHKIIHYPSCGPVPLNVFHPMINVDGPRKAVQAYPAPVPELEGEDIRSCADFQHHGILSGAVNGSSRDEYVVMLFHRNPVHVLFSIKEYLTLFTECGIFNSRSAHIKHDILPHICYNVITYIVLPTFLSCHKIHDDQ